MSSTIKNKWVVVIIAVGLATSALITLETSFSGRNFWEAESHAKELIQSLSDAAIHQLGYNPTQLTGVVTSLPPDPEIKFGGDEAWLCRYWVNPPAEYVQQFTSHGDLRVYLNAQGAVRRIEKGSDRTRELLFGKNQTIESDMTPEQVLEQLGQPDLSQSIEKRRGDQVWIYKPDESQIATIEVFFRNQKVTVADRNVVGFPLNQELLSTARQHFKKSKTLKWAINRPSADE